MFGWLRKLLGFQEEKVVVAAKPAAKPVVTKPKAAPKKTPVKKPEPKKNSGKGKGRKKKEDDVKKVEIKGKEYTVKTETLEVPTKTKTLNKQIIEQPEVKAVNVALTPKTPVKKVDKVVPGIVNLNLPVETKKDET